MNSKDKIMIDTECGQGLPKDVKILMVGRDDTSTKGIMEAVKNAKEGQVIVVDSCAEPKPEALLRALEDHRGMEYKLDRAYDFASPESKRLRKKYKPVSKCGLPGCNVMGERDYCCAEHCKKHRQMKYIRNVRDAKIINRLPLTCFPCLGGDSECVVCSKKMPDYWEKACIECGDTLCRKHTIERNGLSYCPNCGGNI